MADKDLVIWEAMKFMVDGWPTKSSDIQRDLHAGQLLER